jgi:ferric-dicitrate binding protein FerR (iron transport regulator)
MSREFGMARRAVVTGMAAGAVALVGGPAWAEDPPAGVVQAVAGEAHAHGSGPARVLAADERVFVGETLATGASSRLGVVLGRLTQLRLGAESRLKIDKYIVDAGGEFVLEGGVMRFERSRTARTPDLIFRSAFGVMAVRGTRFYAGPSRGAFGVFVDHGRVAVTAAGRTVTVAAGQGTDIAAPGRPPTPPRRWSAPRVAEMVASVT